MQLLGVYPSRTGSWITPKELAGLVGMDEVWKSKPRYQNLGMFSKKMPRGGKEISKINHVQGFAKCSIKTIRLYHNIPRNTEWNTFLTGAQNQDVRHISAPSYQQLHSKHINYRYLMLNLTED